MQTTSKVKKTYIVKGISGFVHSTIQQFGDAKLLDVPSDFIGGSAQDVICLGKEEELTRYLHRMLSFNQHVR